MRWPVYFILAYVIIGLHAGLAGFVTWHGLADAAPNLVLPVVVFIAINAKREEALAGVMTLGFLQDLFSSYPMGLYTFGYSMVGLFLVGMQAMVYRDHPLTHFFLTLLAGTITGGILMFHEWAWPILHGIEGASRPAVTTTLAGILYTALLAPVILFPLTRLKSLFGFRGSRSPGSRYALAGAREA